MDASAAVPDPSALGPPPVPEPPPPPPAALGAGVGVRPLVRLQGQVTHKRTYGNKLVFLDIRRQDKQASANVAALGGEGGLSVPEGASGHQPSEMEMQPADAAATQIAESVTGSGERPSETELETAAADSKPAADVVEVVFSFEVYGAEVRRIRKDISVGDVVRFEGAYRECGRILDAVVYEIFERWSDATGGRCFNFLEGMANRSIPAACRSEASNEGSASICKFWVSNGVCRRTDCKCEHPDGEELRLARGQYWDAQKKRKVETADPEDPHRLEDKKSHAQRASVFADWLCSTYGLERLRSGGVLDVAGGRGDLAFELAVKRGIPCTVVDPRCPGAGRAPLEGLAPFSTAEAVDEGTAGSQ